MAKSIFTLAVPVIDYGVIRIESNHTNNTVDMIVDDEIEDHRAEVGMDEEELDNLIETLMEARILQFGFK